MTDSGPRRRDVLVAVSGTSILLAGCTERDSSTASEEGATVDHSGYGNAYGYDYRHGSE